MTSISATSELPEKLRRWRLILGADSEERFHTMGSGGLSPEQDRMDQALAAIYGGGANTFAAGGAGGAGRGPAAPEVCRWLGDVRELFDKELVAIVQADAMERCGLKQLLFEPELLENLEPDLNLASAILTLKEQIPQRSKESVRAFIAKIVAEINKLLESDIRRAVTAAVNRRQHSPLPSAAALDFPYTIRRNLKNYRPELGTIIPERCWFFDRTTTSAANRRHVILDIDQSGSMGESVIYSSVMSCILASMAAVKVNVVAFDTNIVDLSDKCEDPVELLYGFQLGGGTDINRSVAYCSAFVENPAKTLFFLITDLMEGGNQAGLLKRLRDLKESGVTVITLLAISDAGKPCYDEEMAGKVAKLGIPVFACTPQLLPQLLERAFRGHDLAAFSKEFSKRKN